VIDQFIYDSHMKLCVIVERHSSYNEAPQAADEADVGHGCVQGEVQLTGPAAELVAWKLSISDAVDSDDNEQERCRSV